MEDNIRAAMESEIRAMTQLEQQMHRMVFSEDDATSSSAESPYPDTFISPTAPEVQLLKPLWTRFVNWLDESGASDHMSLNPPASSDRFFPLQESLAQGLGDESFDLPQIMAFYSLHDGQSWSSVTGLIGRWFLLDCDSVFSEWRDQKEMMEMGLYAGNKYRQALKSSTRHPRIDTSYWFNNGWIPIATSRGQNLGGDLIWIRDGSDPLQDKGQIILYMTESSERIVLANSFSEWIEQIVTDLEEGVY